MKRRSAFGLMAIAWLVSAVHVALAAPPGAPAKSVAATSSVTVYHWWTSPSESAALGALVQLFQQNNPGVKVHAEPMGKGGVRWGYPILRQLVAENRPLDAFQANGGSSTQVFHDAGFLGTLDDLWAEHKLERVIPPLIRDLCRIEGHYYAIPINVHRTNVIWYNKPLLDKHKIDPASITSWEALFKAADTLRAGQVRFPIQMGTTWTAAHVFESIMASLGIEAFEDWINGKISSPDDPRLVKAVNTFGAYVGYVNDDHANLGWDVAIRRVMNGESAFCLIGDFANGEFRSAGMKYGRDYGAFVVPETKGMFGVNVDTFVRPRAIGNPVNSNRWMSLVASREGQDAFNPLKGSIPARTDSELSAYDPYQRSAIADFKSAHYLYPNSASALPEGFNNQVNEALVAFMADLNAAKARASLAGAAVRLKGAGTYRRTWSLR